ncbi:MAG: hypothetical protein WC321_03905 [Candidatus Omnitrophota bacterium]|jgi:hypothetical protein
MMKKSKIKIQNSKLQFKIKNPGFCITILLSTFYILNSCGCAAVSEGAKGIAGLSTRCLEEARQNSLTQAFKCDYKTCYDKSREILKEMDAYIYAQDKKKGMVAVYVSSDDTTPVGLFFKELDEENTQIEVSSPSTYAKEFIATQLFSELVIALNPEKKEEAGKDLPRPD